MQFRPGGPGAAAGVFDVVVVGGGGAGLAAAIEARATGASVILLEKNPQPHRRFAAAPLGRHAGLCRRPGRP